MNKLLLLLSLIFSCTSFAYDQDWSCGKIKEIASFRGDNLQKPTLRITLADESRYWVYDYDQVADAGRPHLQQCRQFKELMKIALSGDKTFCFAKTESSPNCNNVYAKVIGN